MTLKGGEEELARSVRYFRHRNVVGCMPEPHPGSDVSSLTVFAGAEGGDIDTDWGDIVKATSPLRSTISTPSNSSSPVGIVVGDDEKIAVFSRRVWEIAKRGGFTSAAAGGERERERPTRR